LNFGSFSPDVVGKVRTAGEVVFGTLGGVGGGHKDAEKDTQGKDNQLTGSFHFFHEQR